jgi:hypothetical protein
MSIRVVKRLTRLMSTLKRNYPVDADQRQTVETGTLLEHYIPDLPPGLG